MKQPLKVYIIWHPGNEEGLLYARALYSEFKRNINEALSRGIGIPVEYRYMETKNHIPIGINLDKAEHTVVIALIDPRIVINDNWKSYLRDIFLEIEKRGRNDLFIPVAITDAAFTIDIDIGMVNGIRLFQKSAEEKLPYLLENVSHELCRMLYAIEHTDAGESAPPLKLFLSHAKADGIECAKEIHSHLTNTTSIKTFYDVLDIKYGERFDKKIKESIKKSTLLAIQTDFYASREWCRKEFLYAKEHSRPIIILNCYSNRDERSFPYMYNVPVVHKNESKNFIQDLIRIILHETLRFRYHELYMEYMCDFSGINRADIIILSRPPELISFIYNKDLFIKEILYPDPPLGEAELEILGKLKQKGQFITPTLLPLLG